MDVEEEDVASWLDSLYANNQHTQTQHPSSSSNPSSKILLNHEQLNMHECSSINEHELNGNNGDRLLPRGDPLMGSYTNFEL